MVQESSRMTLPLLRWTSSLFRQEPVARPAAARLDRLTPEDRHLTVVDYSAARDLIDPAPRPLYDSSAYHSRLEELPTFAVSFLSDAAEEQIAQILEARHRGHT
jgi:hypothetical protein